MHNLIKQMGGMPIGLGAARRRIASYAKQAQKAGAVLYLDARMMDGSKMNNKLVTQDNDGLDVFWKDMSSDDIDPGLIDNGAGYGNWDVHAAVEILGDAIRMNGTGGWVSADNPVLGDIEPDTKYTIVLEIIDTNMGQDSLRITPTGITPSYGSFHSQQPGIVFKTFTSKTDLSDKKFRLELHNTAQVGEYIELRVLALRKGTITDINQLKGNSATLNNFAGTDASGLSFDIAVSEVKADLESPGSLAFENMLGDDGKFEEDTNRDGLADGWTGNGATYSHARGIQSFTASSIYQYIKNTRLANYIYPGSDQENEYYICANVRADSSEICLQLVLDYSAGGNTQSFAYHSGSGDFEILSLTRDLRQIGEVSSAPVYVSERRNAGYTQVDVSDFHVFNLTAIQAAFPFVDRAWMDKFMQSCYKQGIYVNGQNIYYAICEYLVMDGADDHAVVGSGPETGDKYALGVTVSRKDLLEHRYFVAKSLGSLDGSEYLIKFATGGTRLEMYVSHSSGFYGFGFDGLTEDDVLGWLNILMVFKDKRLHLYINGKKATQNLDDITLGTPNNRPLILGGRYADTDALNSIFSGFMATTTFYKDFDDIHAVLAIEKKIAKNYLALNANPTIVEEARDVGASLYLDARMMDGNDLDNSIVSIDNDPMPSTWMDVANDVEKNLLDPNLLKDGYLLNWNSGNPGVNANSVCTISIPVEEGQPYRANYYAQVLMFDANDNYLGVFLDNNNYFIGDSAGGSVNAFTVPIGVGCAYVRLGFRTSYNGNQDMTAANLFFGKGTVSTYVPYAKNNALLHNFAGTENSGLDYDIAVSELAVDLHEPAEIRATNLLGDTGKLLDDNANNVPDHWNSTKVTGLVNAAGVQKFTATGRYGSINKSIIPALGVDHYACAQVKATSSDVKFAMGIACSHSGSGEYELLSVEYTGLGAGTTCKVQDYRASGFDEVEFTHVHIFDLTELRKTYPWITKGWMDKFMEACYKRGIYVNDQTVYYAICEYLAGDSVDDRLLTSKNPFSDFASMDVDDTVISTVWYHDNTIDRGIEALMACREQSTESTFMLFYYNTKSITIDIGSGSVGNRWVDACQPVHGWNHLVVRLSGVEKKIRITLNGTYIGFADRVYSYEPMRTVNSPLAILSDSSAHQYVPNNLKFGSVAIYQTSDYDSDVKIADKIAKNYLALN